MEQATLTIESAICLFSAKLPHVTVLALRLSECGEAGVALIKRDLADSNVGEYVTARFSEKSLQGGEWFSGHYFSTKATASLDYSSRTI